MCIRDRFNIPSFAEGITYAQISAGRYHTAFFQSDGVSVARGSNCFGQCSIPALADSVTYALAQAGQPDLIVQLSTQLSGEAVLVVCRNLPREQVASLSVPLEEQMLPVHQSIGMVLAPGCRRVCIVSPDGRLVAPQLTWQDFLRLPGETPAAKRPRT
mgnify:CR=1 FL=1